VLFFFLLNNLYINPLGLILKIKKKKGSQHNTEEKEQKQADGDTQSVTAC